MRQMTITWDSALRPNKCLLAVSRKLRNIVASKLVLNWSPEQISGWLKIQFPDDASMRVSHETICRSLFIQARGVLKKELMDHLRSKRRMRRRTTQPSAASHAVRSSMPSRSAKDLRKVEDRAARIVVTTVRLGNARSPDTGHDNVLLGPLS